MSFDGFQVPASSTVGLARTSSHGISLSVVDLGAPVEVLGRRFEIGSRLGFNEHGRIDRSRPPEKVGSPAHWTSYDDHGRVVEAP
jgi:hypothetical protein